MTEQVPSDASRIRAIVLTVSGVLVALMLAGVGVLVVTRPSDSTTKQTSIEPAQETSAAPIPGMVASSSTEPSATVATTTPSAPIPSVPGTNPPATGSGAIAFNLGGRLYVSDVTGARLTPVSQASENYALSPDGAKLAVVAFPLAQGSEGTTASGQIAIIDVATQAVFSVGLEPADYPVSWSPDSSWLAYTARDGESLAIKRVQVDGSDDRVIARQGANPRVSRDGKYVAYAKRGQSGHRDPLMVLTLATNTKRAVPDGDGALAWGWGVGDRLFFTTSVTGSPQEGELWRYRVGAASSRKLGTVSIESPAYSLTDIRVSPNGKRVLMAAAGDDHYSRLWVFDTSAERFSAIQTRRDAYPCCWAGNDEILYFEGNSYQGEPSALASIQADGTVRRLIVRGAQR